MEIFVGKVLTVNEHARISSNLIKLEKLRFKRERDS